MTANIKSLYARLEQCMLRDRHPLRRQLDRLRNAARQSPDAQRLREIEQRIQASCAQRSRRQAAVPPLSFDASLPVNAHAEDILQALDRHQVVVVCGETGSGKTTQLPKLCLRAGRGTAGMIGHTQPRRIAARAIADRLAEELRSTLGREVGYKVRFTEQVSPDCHIKLMTDGILLQEIQQDRFLEQYDTLIIDEAHERSLNIDLLLGYIKSILPRRRDLKVIITSATIDPQRFADFFSAPVLQVSGRMYPVAIRYRPPLEADTEESEESPLEKSVLDAIGELAREPAGDILVFFYGENAIRQCHRAAQKRYGHRYEILPLYSRQTAQEQNRIFHPGARPRIILATNVAETSLTVPGIRYVVDSGDARFNRYNYRSKVQRLPVEKISQASANQRAGRCGRQQDGICIRLYDSDDFQARPVFTEPEILRANLAGVILRMYALGMDDIAEFPFLDPPDSRYVRDGVRVLQELQGLDASEALTELGRQLSRLPVDPRIGAILLAASRHNCLREMLPIAAFLSIQDPRESGVELRDKAREKHQEFADDQSDFITILNLWHWQQEQRKSLSNRGWRRLCADYHLSATRMQEWADVRHQLAQMLREQDYRINQLAADYESLHKALLCGFVSQIAQYVEEGAYRGARNRTLYLHPTSVLRGKTPAWIVSAQVIETSRTWAVCAARIEPHWTAEVAQHLTRSSYFDPYWDADRGQAYGYENVVLYGLTVIAGRRIYYGNVDPAYSRELFLRQGLVAGRLPGRFAFVEQNRNAVEQALQVEDKLRRLGIVDAENRLYEFYSQRVPAPVMSAADLKTWLQTAAPGERDLTISEEQLLGAQATASPEHPDHLRIGRHEFSLSYNFAPGEVDDGVTLEVPIMLLNQLDADTFSWLVPGMLREKITQLIKSLAKPLRRNFVPAPDFADAAVQRLRHGEGNLLRELATALKAMTGVEVKETDWGLETLPAHLRMNFRVRDPAGKVIGQSRDLAFLRDKYRAQAVSQFQRQLHWSLESGGHRTWDFADLPAEVHQQLQGIDCTGYPALVDEGDSVAIRVFDNPSAAQQAMAKGLLRLYMLDLHGQVKYLQKNLPDLERICLLFSTEKPCADIRDALLARSFAMTFLGDTAVIRGREQYARIRETNRSALVGQANQLCRLVLEIMQIRADILRKLTQMETKAPAVALADIRRQITQLTHVDFIASTPQAMLEHFPRYLRAALVRLEKLPGRADKDARLAAECGQATAWYEKLAAHPTLKERYTAQLHQLQWMLQELRVALFAQELRTPQPISLARISKFLEQHALQQYL